MRTAKWLGFALYAIVLVLAPFTHHDIECHLKNPQHCTACSSTQASVDPATIPGPIVAPLVELGWAVLSYRQAENVVLAAGLTGRSPPASV
jgi:hypothetical protein